MTSIILCQYEIVHFIQFDTDDKWKGQHSIQEQIIILTSKFEQEIKVEYQLCMCYTQTMDTYYNGTEFIKHAKALGYIVERLERELQGLKVEDLKKLHTHVSNNLEERNSYVADFNMLLHHRWVATVALYSLVQESKAMVHCST